MKITVLGEYEIFENGDDSAVRRFLDKIGCPLEVLEDYYKRVFTDEKQIKCWKSNIPIRPSECSSPELTSDVVKALSQTACWTELSLNNRSSKDPIKELFKV